MACKTLTFRFSRHAALHTAFPMMQVDFVLICIRIVCDVAQAGQVIKPHRNLVFTPSQLRLDLWTLNCNCVQADADKFNFADPVANLVRSSLLCSALSSGRSSCCWAIHTKVACSLALWLICLCPALLRMDAWVLSCMT